MGSLDRDLRLVRLLVEVDQHCGVDLSRFLIQAHSLALQQAHAAGRLRMPAARTAAGSAHGCSSLLARSDCVDHAGALEVLAERLLLWLRHAARARTKAVHQLPGREQPLVFIPDRALPVTRGCSGNRAGQRLVFRLTASRFWVRGEQACGSGCRAVGRWLARCPRLPFAPCCLPAAPKGWLSQMHQKCPLAPTHPAPRGSAPPEQQRERTPRQSERSPPPPGCHGRP